MKKHLKIVSILDKKTTDKQEVPTVLKDVNVDLAAEYSDVYLSDYNNTPHKSLLFAVLERSLSDLFIRETDTPNKKYKKDAIRWFLSPETNDQTSFSFAEVVYHLEISSTTTRKLMALAWSLQCKTGKYYDLYSRYRSRYNRGIHDN